MAKINPAVTGNFLSVEQNLKRSVFLAGIAETSAVEKYFNRAGGFDWLRFNPRLVPEQAHRPVAAVSFIKLHI